MLEGQTTDTRRNIYTSVSRRIRYAPAPENALVLSVETCDSSGRVIRERERERERKRERKRERERERGKESEKEKEHKSNFVITLFPTFL